MEIINSDVLTYVTEKFNNMNNATYNEKGEEIGIRIDQTLTQDATGTMAYLELEAMDIDKVKTELSVAYIDHNTLQTGFENADDHRFIGSVCKKHGIYFLLRSEPMSDYRMSSGGLRLYQT